MKKRYIITIIAASVVLIIPISFLIYVAASGPFDDMYRDRVEYPLAKVNQYDESNYLLVKWQHSPYAKYEVITDTQMIKDNKFVFSVSNKGGLYATTSDGIIWLYKDGKLIDKVIFDNTLTKRIKYGSLRFKRTNQLQFHLLIGYEFVEQGENYSILSDNKDKPYFYCYAHGDDLHNPYTVYFINSDSDIDKVAKPRKVNDDVIEFIEHSENYAGDQTRHWYFRLSDNKLSQWYWNVRAIKDNLIAYAAGYMNGGKSRIIIHDMFDKSVGYKVIYGDFPDPRDDDFLLSAEFTADGGIRAEYIGNDGQVHNDVFTLD